MTDRTRELEDEVERLKSELAAIERAGLDAVLRTVGEHVPDNVILIDREHRIRYINWTVPELTIERVLGTPVLHYVPEKYRAGNAAAYDRAFETGEPDRLEFEYYSADGSISRWVTRVVPLRDPHGALDRLVLISTNYTEREGAARDRDRFFQLSPDLLCVATLAGFFKRVSPAFTSVLGWSQEELLEIPFLEFVHPDDRDPARRALESLTRGDSISGFEIRFQTKSGRYKIIEWSSIAEPESGLIYAVGRDVTERRELEAELRQSRKMESIGQLAGGVAHDFNNLILAIQLNAQFAGDSSELARRAEHLEEIRRCTKRAAELTRQLLVLGRRQPLKKAPIDLAALIEELSRMLRRTFPASVRIEFKRPPNDSRALADRAQIEQVLLNLCLNARDAMPDGGLLRVQLEHTTVDESASRAPPNLAPGRYVVIVVADDGIGMSGELQERIFEPFFTTKPPGAGTGLGLSTVYGIVEQHGGAVRVESTVGGGSSFRIYLPETEAAPEADAPAAPEPAGGGNETILVADDFDQVRKVVVRLLESAGYCVITARDGEEALNVIRDRGQEIELALLDVVMPHMSGYEVAMLGSAMHPGLRVLFTSGYNHVPDSGAAIPDEQLIRKPYSSQDLLARVRAALNEPRARRA